MRKNIKIKGSFTTFSHETTSKLYNTSVPLAPSTAVLTNLVTNTAFVMQFKFLHAKF